MLDVLSRRGRGLRERRNELREGARAARALPAAAMALVCLAGAGCASARITRLDSKPEISAYPAHSADEVLAVGVEVQDRPGDARFWLDARYRDRGLLVLSARLRNTGSDSLLLRRGDLVITTRSARKLAPIPPLEAIGRVTGFMGVYHPLSLGTITDGYETFALPETVLLEPGREVAGYLYFAVPERQWDDAARGRLTVSFLRLDVVGGSEYDLNLAR